MQAKNWTLVCLLILLSSALFADTVFQAAQSGDLETIQQLIKENPELIHAQDQDQTQPLHISAYYGHVELTRWLIQNGAPLDAIDSRGLQPLHLATWGQHEAIIELLIDNGADVNARSFDGQTPLIIAVFRNNSDLIYSLLSKGGDINATDNDGLSVLAKAVELGSELAIDALMSYGADLQFKTDDGLTLLHIAAWHGKAAITRLLIQHGLNVNAVTYTGDTPLHGAAFSGYLDVIRALKELGARQDIKNNSQKTALDYARENNQGQAASLITGTTAKGATQTPSSFSPAGAPIKNEVTFQILYDNYTAVPDVESDWGFSCLIKGAEQTILFDTGTKPSILMSNIKALKVDLTDIDAIVLSHNHYDHTGGVEEVLKIKSNIPVYFPDTFPFTFYKNVEKWGAHPRPVKNPQALCPGVYTTGRLGDRIPEQALWLDTNQGLVIVTGCSHPGIEGMVKRIHGWQDKPIHLVFGGFHLMNHTPEQIQTIIDGFEALNIQRCGATHCTGEAQIEQFKAHYGDRYQPMGVGRRIVIKP